MSVWKKGEGYGEEKIRGGLGGGGRIVDDSIQEYRMIVTKQSPHNGMDSRG